MGSSSWRKWSFFLPRLWRSYSLVDPAYYFQFHWENKLRGKKNIDRIEELILLRVANLKFCIMHFALFQVSEEGNSPFTYIIVDNEKWAPFAFMAIFIHFWLDWFLHMYIILSDASKQFFKTSLLGDVTCQFTCSFGTSKCMKFLISSR